LASGGKDAPIKEVPVTKNDWHGREIVEGKKEGPGKVLKRKNGLTSTITAVCEYRRRSSRARQRRKKQGFRRQCRGGRIQRK